MRHLKNLFKVALTASLIVAAIAGCRTLQTNYQAKLRDEAVDRHLQALKRFNAVGNRLLDDSLTIEEKAKLRPVIEATSADLRRTRKELSEIDPTIPPPKD